MTTNQAAMRLLSYFSPEERSIPDSVTYPGCNAAVAGAINGALQRLFVNEGPWVRKDARAALVYSPAVVTANVTHGSTSAAISGWQDWMSGCLITIDGVENRIKNDSASATLKIPYSGTTGTKPATVWCDAINIASDAIQVHDPVTFAGARLTPLPGHGSPASLATFRDYGQTARLNESNPTSGLVASAGRPHYHSLDTWTKDATTPVLLRLMLSPVPSVSGVVEYAVTLKPPVVSNLSATDDLPIPCGLDESVFMPMATMFLFDSPFFRGVSAPDSIVAKYQEALATIQKVNPKTASPRFLMRG